MILAASFGLPYWPGKLGELGQLLSPTVFTYEDLQKPIVYEQWAFVRVVVFLQAADMQYRGLCLLGYVQ